MYSTNRKLAYAHANFSISKIHVRKPSVDVNKAKANHIKFRYPKEPLVKNVFFANMICVCGSKILCTFCCTVYKLAVSWMLRITLRSIRALTTASREIQASTETNGTSNVVKMDIKTSKEPGVGPRRKKCSATQFNHFKKETISKGPSEPEGNLTFESN